MDREKLAGIRPTRSQIQPDSPVALALTGPQLQHRIKRVSKESQYCKVVQADDYIFPECLQLMVQAIELSASIGLVSSYWLKGSTVRGSGFPFDVSVLHGAEMARKYLRTGIWVFGSPTAVLYRSSIVSAPEHSMTTPAA